MNNIPLTIEKALRENLECRDVRNLTPSPRGVLNQCYIFETDRGKFFVKVNSTQNVAMYEAEARGLQAIKETGTLRVPIPYYYGASEEHSFLILEHLELKHHTSSSQRKLGTQLAQMHLIQQSDRFGFEIDNTIGTTPQINTWTDDWLEFFLRYRLDYQLKLVEERYGDTEVRRKGETFMEKYPSFFEGLKCVPVLLHGDLWSGNTASDTQGHPVVYDPAVYYGHAEADFGILLMFGGFTGDFHGAYRELIPKNPSFEERQLGYQLYHYLNHYNLFGSAYRPSCIQILSSI